MMFKFIFIGKDLIDKFRGDKDKLLAPASKFFYKLHFSPDFLTIISLIFGLTAGWFLYQSNLVLFVLFMFLHALFDAFDGALARYKPLEFHSNYLIDHVADRMIMVSLFIAVALKSPEISVAHILVPIFYMYSHTLYALGKGKLPIVYIRIIYCVILFIDESLATNVALGLTLFNSLILTYSYFGMKWKKLL